jgi:cell wall-associated NlpC family hydrolase
MRKLLFLTFLLISGCGTTHHTNNVNYQYKDNITVNGKLSEAEKSELVLFSMNLIDTKYNWGSKKPDFGLDCSGLVSYVFKKSVNIQIRGAAKDLVKHGNSVPINFIHQQKLEPGDLLFFNTTGKSYSHVGIYIGNNQFLHASSAKGKVITSSIHSKYYIERLEEIKRI